MTPVNQPAAHTDHSVHDVRSLYTESWRRPRDNAFMQLSIHRCSGGIVQRMYADGVLLQETFSPRPYQLGQSCDGTIDVCVMALFVDYCSKHGLSHEALYRQAYPDTAPTAADWFRILAQAASQGVAIPCRYGPAEFELLLESLHEINNHALVEVLSDESVNAKTRAKP